MQLLFGHKFCSILSVQFPLSHQDAFFVILFWKDNCGSIKYGALKITIIRFIKIIVWYIFKRDIKIRAKTVAFLLKS